MDRYSQTRLVNAESVLEHTGWVCMCSFFIAMELNELGEGINIGSLMSKAAIHDVEEVIVGDVANPTKYYSEELTKQIGDMSASAAYTLLSQFNSVDSLMDIWEKSKIGTEGYIVALSDKLAVVYKVQQEVIGFGNSTIRDHVKGLEEALNRLEIELEFISIVNRSVIREIIQEAKEICQGIR
jgi:5'-deoxynucleotidase YfbR-like HD superfamily hydrolase